MKRLGIIVLVVAGFVGGIAFVYSCGGGSVGGSELFAGTGDADLLDGYDSSDFALANHAHTEITPGVYPIGPAAFMFIWDSNSHVEGGWSWRGQQISVEDTNVKGYHAITLPFKSTIVEITANVKNRPTGAGDIVLKLHNGTVDSNDELIPIVSLDTTAFAPSFSSVLISTGPVSIPYDPASLNNPWGLTVEFEDVLPHQRLYWAKIYYTVP